MYPPCTLRGKIEISTLFPLFLLLLPHRGNLIPKLYIYLYIYTFISFMLFTANNIFVLLWKFNPYINDILQFVFFYNLLLIYNNIMFVRILIISLSFTNFYFSMVVDYMNLSYSYSDDNLCFYK